MTYYINIDSGKLNGGSELDNSRFATETNFQVEVSKELYDAYLEDSLRYIWDNQSYSIIENPNYDKDKADKRHQEAMEMRMTPLDFLKAIEEYGVTYDMVKQIMEANPMVERELRFCSHVYRKHPMIEQFATQFGITSEQLDNVFIEANQEEE